jgi:ectoine hydroxylase-related dioxygenase (phytanoyl-CoA dioxygenase family)
MADALPSPIEAATPELGRVVAADVEAHGLAVVTGLLEPDACAALVDEVRRVEHEHAVDWGRNEFEGFRTRRIFNLISRSAAFRDLVIHEQMDSIVEAVLGEGYLLSGTTSMHLFPGETAQLLHADDGMITLPRPHPATLVTTLWSLSPFTAENGATRVVPGSHRFEGMPRPGDRVETVAVEMPAGSAVVLHGSTWHGGGDNTTAGEERFGLSIQYVAGWCRQQQNLMLGTPPELVARYPRRLQELIGYSIYRNVMGHVDRKHPRTLIGDEVAPEMVWDRMTTERTESPRRRGF